MQISIELALGLIILAALFAGTVSWFFASKGAELSRQQATSELTAQLAAAEQQELFANREMERLREEAAIAESEGRRLNQELDQLREQRTHFQTQSVQRSVFKERAAG